MSKLPAFSFYPADWLTDSVAGCSIAAQGLWLRMMFIMHDAARYGYLATNGLPMPPETVARRCGCTLDQYLPLLAELESAAVPGRERDGTIFCRRMVRDAAKRKRQGLEVTEIKAHEAERPKVELNQGDTALKPHSLSSLGLFLDLEEEREDLKAKAGGKLFFHIWNERCGKLPKARGMPPTRHHRCRLRSKTISVQQFQEAVERCRETPFLAGGNDRGWRATFDWLIANDENILKVLEGKYDGARERREPETRAEQRQRRTATALGQVFGGAQAEPGPIGGTLSPGDHSVDGRRLLRGPK